MVEKTNGQNEPNSISRMCSVFITFSVRLGAGSTAVKGHCVQGGTKRIEVLNFLYHPCVDLAIADIKVYFFKIKNFFINILLTQ